MTLKDNTNTHKLRTANKKLPESPQNKQNQRKAKPTEFEWPRQEKKSTPEARHYFSLNFFLLDFILKRNTVFVFLFVSTSIKSYQKQDIHLCAVNRNISSYLHVCTPSSVSVFQKGSGCFVHLQNTTHLWWKFFPLPEILRASKYHYHPD